MKRTTGPAEPLLTVEQVALQMSCSIRTIRRRIKAGELPVIRDGRLLRILPEDLRHRIKSCRDL